MRDVAVKKYNWSDWFKVLLCFLIPAIILILPQSDILTRNAKFFLAITVWFLMWAAFEITNLLIPAMAYPAALVFTKTTTVQIAYGSWVNLIIPTIVAAFAISFILDECGLLKRVCFWIVKQCSGSFQRTMFALFFACLAVSVMTFGNAEVIIATFCFGLCSTFGLARKKEAVIIMMVGMLAASTCRACLYYPLFIGPILNATATVDPAFTLETLGLLKNNWPIVLFSLLYICFLFIGSKKNGVGAVISDRGVAYFKEEYSKLGKMTASEKKAAILVIALMLLVSLLPVFKINNMFAFIFIAIFMFMPGVNLGTESAIKKIPLGTLFFVVSCMGIGTVCTEVGLTEHLTMFLTWVLGDMNLLGTLLVILVFGFMANFAMTPLSMMAAFSAPLFVLAKNLGVNPEAFLYTFIFSADMVILPYEFVSYLIFFSFGMMTTGQFFKYHTFKNLLFVLFFLVCIIPYWYLIGLI